MKKIFALGMVLVILIGVMLYLNNCTASEEVSTTEETIIAYEKINRGVDVERVEILDTVECEWNDDDFVDYLGYDVDGNLVACGGVDLSYAEYIIKNS